MAMLKVLEDKASLALLRRSSLERHAHLANRATSLPRLVNAIFWFLLFYLKQYTYCSLSSRKHRAIVLPRFSHWKPIA